MKDTQTQPQEIAGRNGRRRKALRMAVLAVAVLVAVAGIPAYWHAATHESTDDAYLEGHVVPVSPKVAGHVAKVHVADNGEVRKGDLLVELDPRDDEAALAAATASLEAARANYRAQTIGVDLTSIASSTDQEGAQANVASVRASVATAQAAAAAAASEREQAMAQLQSARAGLEEAKADVIQAEANAERDTQDLARMREMAETGAVSRQQLDHAVASARVAAALLDAARKKVQAQEAQVAQSIAMVQAAEENRRQATSQVRARKAQVAQAQAALTATGSAPQQVAQSRTRMEVAKAELDKAEAQAEQARLNLSYTRIYAPCDGVVTRKSVEQGAYVKVGQTLLSLVEPEVWVVANFKETQLEAMRPGQPVDITVDTYPGVSFAGRVDSIQRGTGSRFSLLPAENAAGNFVKVVQRVPVKIVFKSVADLKGYLLAPGMSVEPEVRLTAPEK
ncbi:MAG: HlyD family secretion protein [Desulfovibrionaceae bacterium]